MAAKRHVPIEEMELFHRYVEVGDWAWNVVDTWSPFARDTVGKQLFRAIDSVGANLVEGDGRFSSADAIHFFIIARASAREARFWLKRAIARHLITEEEGERQIEKLASATQLLNKLIAFRRTRPKSERVRELPAEYTFSALDPFVGDEP